MRLPLLAVTFLAIFTSSVAQQAALEDGNPVEFENNYDDQINTVNTETEGENVTAEIPFAEESDLKYNESLEGDGFLLQQSSPRKGETETKKPVVLDPDECGDPPFVRHAIIYEGKQNRYEVNAKVTYACEFGYITDGSVYDSECVLSDDSQNLHWTELEIRCSPRSCGNPGYVTHAHRVGSVFTFPNKVSFECDDGYALRGYGTRYCQTSGAWSGNLPTCEPIFCDPPANPANGKVFYSTLGFESELRYECDSGFILKNDQGRICSANGTWSGIEPTCQEAECEQPQAPKHGTVEVIGDKSSAGSMALYRCNEGRVLLGSTTSRCLDIGEWTFPAPKCLEPCFVPKVERGKIGRYSGRRKKFNELPANSGVADHEELFLRCEPNYEPFGTHFNEVKVTCVHGEWEAVPICEPAMCRGPPPPTANAYVKRANGTHGGGVVYSCRQHAQKDHYGNVTCDFGNWKGVTPVCRDLRCPLKDLSFPGLIKGKKDFYLPGQILNVACEKGFNLTKKNNQLKCENGEWKGHLPPCTSASCNAEALIALEGIIPGDEKMVLNGEYLKVRCPEGYSPSGNTARCSRGEWKLNGKLCQESSCTVYKMNNGGFTQLVHLENCGWFKCTRWTEYQRIRLGEIKNSGSSVYVSCDKRYTFQGKQGNVAQITCTKGKWYPDPVCLFPGTPYKSQEKVPVQKVAISNTRTSTTGEPPVLTSQSVPSGSEVAVDLNQNLDPTPNPPCTCAYLNNDDNLVALAGTTHLTHGSVVQKNEKVGFHCRHFGYSHLEGVSEIKCEDCQPWHSSLFPKCLNPIVGDTVIQFDGCYTILPGGIVGVKEGQQLTVRCFSSGVTGILPLWYASTEEEVHFTSYTDSRGYYVSELNISDASSHHNKKYLCFMQGYRPTAFDFQVISQPSTRCHKFEEGDFDVQYNNNQAFNSSAMFSCKDPHKKIEGPSVVTCLSNGQWSGGPPKCSTVCPNISETEGMGISFTHDLFEGSVAAFHCLEPRIRIGVSWTTCQANGEWANPPSECILSSCSLEQLFLIVPKNVVPHMEGITSDAVPYNFSLRLYCDDKKMLAGSDVATCGQNGRWQVSKVQCVSGCNLPEAENSELIFEPKKDFYRFGESVSLSCRDGYTLNSEVVRLMCLVTSWSESVLPECVKQ